MSRPTTRQLIAAAACVLTAACGSSEGPAAAARPARTFLVETTVTTNADIKVTVDAVGDVRAVEEAEIRPQVDGVLAEVHFEEGSEVSRGDLLFRLDDRKARARLALAEATRDSARARLELNRRRLARQKKLRKEKLISEEEYDAAEAEYLEADANSRETEASVDLAKRQLEDFHITAPFDGKVGERTLDVGNYAEEGSVLVVLMRTDPIDVVFRIPDRFAAKVRPGSAVQIMPGDGGDSLEGNVSFVDPRVDASTRMLTVRAQVPNSDERLRHGQFASVAVVVEERGGQVVIPEEAVLSQEGRTWIFTVEEGQAKKRDVRLGERRPPMVEVLEGVGSGTTLVVGGQHRLADGVPVKSTTESAEAEPQSAGS